MFKPRNKPDNFFTQIKFQDYVLQRVSVYKFLGVLFEEHLSWTPHVNMIHTNISRSLGILYRIRFLVPSWLKRQLYFALVHSHLHYCLLIWGTTTKTNLHRLEVLQKRALRCIENLHPLDHTNPFFIQHNLLKIYEIFNLKLSIHIRNEITRDQGSFFALYLHNKKPYDFRHSRFVMPLLRTNYGAQNLSYLIPELLNKHPHIAELLQQPRSRRNFQNEVKTYLISFYCS